MNRDEDEILDESLASEEHIQDFQLRTPHIAVVEQLIMGIALLLVLGRICEILAKSIYGIVTPRAMEYITAILLFQAVPFFYVLSWRMLSAHVDRQKQKFAPNTKNLSVLLLLFLFEATAVLIFGLANIFFTIGLSQHLVAVGAISLGLLYFYYWRLVAKREASLKKKLKA